MKYQKYVSGNPKIGKFSKLPLKMNTIAKSLLGLFHVQKRKIFSLRRADFACNNVFMTDNL